MCQVLEDRFQGLLEGSLAAAFLQRRAEAVQQLVPMMLSIGRSATVEKLYSGARLAPLQVQTGLCAACSVINLCLLHSVASATRNGHTAAFASAARLRDIRYSRCCDTTFCD